MIGLETMIFANALCVGDEHGGLGIFTETVYLPSSTTPMISYPRGVPGLMRFPTARVVVPESWRAKVSLTMATAGEPGLSSGGEVAAGDKTGSGDLEIAGRDR